jgi:hypothetical protein
VVEDEVDVELLDEVIEGVVVWEVVVEPNGAPISLPLVAICCASVLLNCPLVQSLASS